MTWWEKFIYLIALAFWRAYFDVQMARQDAEVEVPGEKARMRAVRFRDAVRRLRAAKAGGPRPDRPASGGEGNPGGDLGGNG